MVGFFLETPVFATHRNSIKKMGNTLVWDCFYLQSFCIMELISAVSDVGLPATE